jgi:thioredoxin reductase/ferredoxin
MLNMLPFSSFSALLLALLPAAALTLALTVLALRRMEIRRFERSHRMRQEAIERGSHKARLVHPVVDLSRCIGCGSCVRACPEDGVLDLLHGQAVVVHGSRCVGHARCADACPTGALALTFADLSDRRDLPAVSEEFEAVGADGLYIAGELSGYSLVRTAVSHGTAVAEAAARSLARCQGDAPKGHRDLGVDPDDLLIVGVGPAGLACALRARELGLRFSAIDQADRAGGTVSAYPRKKMVMTQPVHLPLYGKLPRFEYQKEELVDLWDKLIKEHQLPVRFGVKLSGVERQPDGTFIAQTSAGPLRARRVCLALGRRGSPRKLGIPGEQLSKVCYSLLDAESYKNRRVLVVGGGDSAIEAALGLAEQPGNIVTLSYRGKDFNRLKGRNDTRIRKAMSAGKVTVLFESNPTLISEEDVLVRRIIDGRTEDALIPNDEVFIFAGGEPPFEMVEKAGVSFDPAKRPLASAVIEQGTALIWAVASLLIGSLVMGGWAMVYGAYYGSGIAARSLMATHSWLRPGGRVGLTLGLLACGLFLWNLTYLIRRSRRLAEWWGRVGIRVPGSLKFWMGTHVFTGLASFMCVIWHAGFIYRNTVGGFAFLALAIVLLSGIIGRYFYAQIPHAANGREMDLDELRTRLTALSTEWERAGGVGGIGAAGSSDGYGASRGVGMAIRSRIDALVDKARWRPSLWGRATEMVLAHVRIHHAIRELRSDPQFADVPREEMDEMLLLAKRAYRLTVQITHYEEMRAVLSTWRYFHRWLALLMVLFVVSHIATAVRYAKLDWPLVSQHAVVAPAEGAAK